MHLAEIGTTLASGVSHWRFGNVNWPVVRRIGIPGAIGAFAGATFLSSLSTENAAPWMAGHPARARRLPAAPLLHQAARAEADVPPRKRFLAPLGLFAGFIDATGGGGWGPVATPTLISSGRMTPRKVIGTVDTSEFLVAVAASLGFFIGIGSEDIPWSAVGGPARRRPGRRPDRGLPGAARADPAARRLGGRPDRRHQPAHPAQRLRGRQHVRPEIYAVAFTVWALALGLALQGLRKDRREERPSRSASGSGSSPPSDLTRLTHGPTGRPAGSCCSA